MRPDTLAPGATVGILGGGQLGRMLAMAAARLGMKTHIYCPDPQSPAFDVTPWRTVAPYEDEAALAAFAEAVDVVTYEFENVPAATAHFIAARVPLRPDAKALAIAQDRLQEKAFLAINRIPLAPFAAIPDWATLNNVVDEVGSASREAVRASMQAEQDAREAADDTLRQLRLAAEAELQAALDAGQAELGAALAGRPFPTGGPAPLDLTPPEEEDDSLDWRVVLKTTRGGYDGKGQRMVETRGELEEAFAALAPKPLVLEGNVPFEKEISVIVARALDGTVRAYDAAENVHRDHILKTSTVPAAIADATADEARRLASTIAGALGYVGVLGVEFFALWDGTLFVNEIAPRVHNSGHWTEAVCACDQFEQHIRAVCGWPLGDTARSADVVMENLIGDEVEALPASLGPGARLHLYGKAEVRPGRKMGHVNRVTLRPGP